ncbi:MAG: YpmA family protein [Peptococcaceae bacterium]|jgi:hypothetical protein|nr:YpmA family protein [Peptococcaceae bacterium]MDH7525710.1 YpmA family protein [Peptococcaceae bacterium]
MEGQEGKEAKLVLLATKSFPYYDEMYQVIDFLNKNIKDKHIMLGLTKSKETNTMKINVYEF